jgi:hypothetical protein
VGAWLERHPRFHVHFPPTSTTWLNMVEIIFGRLTEKAIRRSIFHSVPDLIDAIEAYLAEHNKNSQPEQIAQGRSTRTSHPRRNYQLKLRRLTRCFSRRRRILRLHLSRFAEGTAVEPQRSAAHVRATISSVSPKAESARPVTCDSPFSP